MEFNGDDVKIAQISATFPPYLAGTGNVCFHNSIELAKLGHDVTVFTKKYQNNSFEYPKSIKVNGYKPLFQIGNAPFIPELLQIKDFDIVHLHYPFYFGGEMIYFLSKFKNINYVITYHNDVIFNGFLNFLVKIHEKTVMRRILRNAKKIFVHSLDFAEHSFLSPVVKENSGKIAVIPNGVDINTFNPNLDPNKIKRRLGLEHKQIILFVGALDKAHYFKGVDYLIQSFARIQSEDTVLIIVGEGDLKKKYIKLANKSGISSKTLFVGRISDYDLPDFYAAADIIVLPSVDIECFGIVLLEAMACGKPVIASNLPGVRTVVNDGINGFLVQPKDYSDLAIKMQNLLDNKQLKINFGEKGREKVEQQYSWDKIAKKLEQSYLEIL